MAYQEQGHGVAAGSIERDLARLNTFLEAERDVLLCEARQRRAWATEEERRWVERQVSGPKEMERRLEEGLDALMDRMDEETAAAALRLAAIFAALGQEPVLEDGHG